MMDDSALRERYLSVLDRLGEAIARAGRKPEEVRLIAVSKLHPAEDVACVAAAGQVDFGENYVQEALQKRQDLVAQPQCRDIRWHMIGHVQSRKAAQVAGAFALVHTLDSVKLADALEKRAAALGVVQPVLCEINVGEEPQKAGIMADALPELEDARREVADARQELADARKELEQAKQQSKAQHRQREKVKTKDRGVEL